MNNLRKLDLNQMVTLLFLLRERHVSRAAELLHKSQPAVSHSLNHLRELFQDPLLIRHNGQYQLTSKAESLYQPLAQALIQLDGIIEQQDFKPIHCQRRFNIAMSDYGAALISIKLIHYLCTYAPDVDIKIWHCSREEMQSKLHEGSLDLAFGVFNSLDYTLRSQSIFTDKLVSVMDKSVYPKLTISLTDWLSYPHILVSMKPFDANEIDHHLQLINQQRRIAITVPYWQIAPQLLEKTNLILTIAQKAIPKDMIENFSIFKPPFDIPALEFQMIWHQRSDNDSALNWLRETIINLLKDETKEQQ